MVTMEFFSGLPRKASKRDIIWVIVDILSKSAYFLAEKKTDGADLLGKKYVDEI